MTSDERPTLRTIARLTGLAVSTVSRALGDAPDIGADTKETVRAVAREIGYVPDRAGVRLRTGRTNVIGLVLEKQTDLINMTTRLIAALAQGLAGTRYHLVMTPEMPDQTPLDAVKYLVETRAADALIINRTQPEDPRVAFLMERDHPFVSHGRTIWSDRHSFYDYDNEAFGRVAVERIVARGRRSILVLAPPLDMTYARHIHEGVTRACAALGIEPVVPERITSDSSEAELREHLPVLLAANPSIDSLISASPNAAMIATSVIEGAGHTLGHDFDIIAKETVPTLKLFRPAMLSIYEDVEKAGTALARAAMLEIESNRKKRVQIVEPFIDSPTGD